MLILQDYESAEKLFEQAAQWLLRLLHDQGGKETQPFEISIRQIDTLTKIILCENLDRYIKQRIETDKVLIGILKDIVNNTDGLAESIQRINSNVGPQGNRQSEQKGVQTMRDETNGGAGVVAEIEAPPAASPEPAAAPETPEPAAAPEQPEQQVPAAPQEPAQTPETPETPAPGDGQQ